MIIQIDTREKARAIKKILKEFDAQEITHINSKMYVGDYCALENPLLIIDRKQNMAEIAQNCTSGHDRFKRELQRLDDMNAKMYVLIEQDTIDKRPIETLEDVMLWSPKYSTIEGPRIYKVMNAWEHKHNIKFVFCRKADTGKEIIRLLKEG
jgi:ERCC4-type nuclease